MSRQIVVRTTKESKSKLEIALMLGCKVITCNPIGDKLEYVLEVSDDIFNIRVPSYFDSNNLRIEYPEKYYNKDYIYNRDRYSYYR